MSMLLTGCGVGGAGVIVAPTAASQFTAANVEGLYIADNPSLSFGDESYTIAGWVYYDSFAGFNPIVAKYADDGGVKEYYLAHRRDSNNWAFGTYASGGGSWNGEVNKSQTLSTGTWYFVVAGYDAAASQHFISVDNSAITTAAASGNQSDSTAEFSIGISARGAANYVHNGRICKVGVWRKKLTTDEISSLYNSGNGLAYCQLSGSLLTSLEGYWNLNESSGTRYDSTANANNLTDNNTVTGNPGVGSGNCL